MENTVIFLGAGASMADGAPSQANLFVDYFRSVRSNPENIDSHLVIYFKEFWQIDVVNDNLDEIIFPTFEEALGMLEMARDRQEAFRGFYHTPNSNGIGHTIEDLIFLIAKILKLKLAKSGDCHNTLVAKLSRRRREFRKIDFISLNYDILIDNALTTVYPDFDLDYGVDFLNFRRRGDWRRPRITYAKHLYKIHGSLNWLYCPVCNGLHLTPKEKGVSQLIEKPTPRCNCGGRYTAILVPPTFFKVMSNPYLVSIWTKAETSLRKADRLIFCGYSLPDADIHIKYLLKRAQLNRATKKPLQVTVVNHYDGKKENEQSQEKLRYERLFGKDSVKYNATSFSEFAESPYKLISS